MQILADTDSAAAKHSENVIDYYAHANDEEEAEIEEGLKIEDAKHRILFQVLSDFIFDDVIEFDEAAYRRDLRSRPDDGDINPSPYQVLAGERLLNLRNYYRHRGDTTSEKTALSQEIYRMLTDLRKDVRQDITEVLHRYNKDKNKTND